MKQWGTKKEIYTHKCMMILKHRYLYYVLNDPEILDHEYDKLEAELREFEKNNSRLIHFNSPTRNVGSSDISSYPTSLQRLFKGRQKVKKTKQIKTKQKEDYQVI